MAKSNSTSQEKSKKPSDTKFKQQKLPAWKPILTPKTVLPNIAIVGVIFIAVGIALYLGSDSVREFTVNYTECQNTGPDQTGESCDVLLDDFENGFTNLSRSDVRCTCEVEVDINNDFGGRETFLYYALDNFYQNHRAYVSSRWDAQLRAVTTSVSGECSPLDRDENGNKYAPCGLVANSLFNDTIRISRCLNGDCSAAVPVSLSGRHIAWESDRRTKFNNPTPDPGQDLCDAPGFVDGAKLPNWPVPACQMGRNTSVYHAQSPLFNSSGVGYENEDFIVWMRTAALPNFRKLYRRVKDPLPNGKYVFHIDYNYPVKNFNGEKKIVLSTLSWQGGRNPFLGICYLVVGGLCFAIVGVFLILIKFKGRELGSDDYLQWDS